MARLSKSTHSGTATLDPPAREVELEESIQAEDASQFRADDADDERRHSVATTISSYPESSWQSDTDLLTPILKLYTPQPRSRNLRSQGDSHSPFGSPSPRRARLTQSHGRLRTSRSLWSTNVRGSPKTRRRISDATEGQPEADEKHYPLVLLRVTLLPVDLPWSLESMQELLPASMFEDLRHLRTKISSTILNRGILISHPQEEYELLEERLLEALELTEERVTKCGHFRNPSSTSSSGDSDSGVGFSADEDVENDLCAICQHHIKPSRGPFGNCGEKWCIRIFAANGLMRASAWTAAWPDMESVDVEILPRIGKDLRRKLDARKAEEESLDHQCREQDVEGIERLVEEKVQLALAQQKRVSDDETNPGKRSHRSLAAPQRLVSTESREMDVPPIYRPSQIPLSTLLRNYLYLVLRQRRNVTILLFLVIFSILFFSRLALMPTRALEIEMHTNAQPSAGVSTGNVAEKPRFPRLGADPGDLHDADETCSAAFEFFPGGFDGHEDMCLVELLEET